MSGTNGPVRARRAGGARCVMFVLLLAASTYAQDTVRVVDADGAPVAGARVEVLGWADVDIDGPHATLVEQRATSDAEGEAKLRLPIPAHDTVCLFAYDETRAVFACHTTVADVRASGFRLRLGPARRLRGRIVDGAGEPVAAARLRAIFPGGYEMHGIDARVAKDGSFSVPPLPVDVLARGPTLQARAPGKAPFELELGAGAATEGIVVRLENARRLVGRIRDAKTAPVAGAGVWIGAWTTHNRVTSDADGAFTLATAPASACTVHVLSPRHALLSIAVPAGDGETDLGALVVAEGGKVVGSVREFEDARILRAFVALQNADGIRVRSAEIGPAGLFVLPGIGPGAHTLDCWVHAVEGVGGSRHLSRVVRAGSRPVDLVVPEGVRLRFRDANGAPCPVYEVGLTIDSPAWSESLARDFQAMADAVHEVRLLLGADLAFTAWIRARGYEETVLRDATTDVHGRLAVDVELDRKEGESLTDAPAAGFPRRPGSAGGLPPARFEADAPKDEVAAHVRAVLAKAAGRNSYSTADPELRALQEVGGAHVDVLVEQLEAMKPHQDGRTWLLWAIEALAGESHRTLVLQALPRCRDLAHCVVNRGWAKDARETLLAALRESPSYLPPAWIDAVAALRDPRTYDLLLHYLAHGSNPHLTWRAIRNLPDLDARATVAMAWPEKRKRRWKREMFAVVAVEFGHIDALGTLIDALGGKRPYSTVAHAVERHVEFRGTPAELLAWFHEHEDTLVFNPNDGIYRPK